MEEEVKTTLSEDEKNTNDNDIEYINAYLDSLGFERKENKHGNK